MTGAAPGEKAQLRGTAGAAAGVQLCGPGSALPPSWEDRTPRAAGTRQPPGTGQPGGAEVPSGAQSADPIAQVPQSAPGPSLTHLLRPPLASPISPLPPPRKTTRSPLASLSSGGAEAGEGGDRKGVGTSKDSPSLPRPPPPPQLGSRHVVPGVGGEEKRLDFLDARFASSSFSLRRQLRGRSAPPERAGDGSRERSREPRAGDAGAAGGTCGSSRRRRSPRRQQRGPPKLRQPPPRRPGQYPPRSPPRRHLPAPGPAAPGGCGSSASQRRFADCSCFKVRGEAGSPARGARRVHRRPLAPRAAQGLPRWSSAAAGAQRRREGKSPGRAPREESRRRVCRTRAADARCSDCTV